jgi:hypothetical protein
MKRGFAYFSLIFGLILSLCACQPSGDDIILELVNKDPSNLLYTFDHQKVSLEMDCNRSWKAACSEEWIEIETVKGSEGEGQKFVFVLSSNKAYTYRTGEVVIKAGDRDLVLTITQEPEIVYYIKENFDVYNLYVEQKLPSGWLSVDIDGDDFGWKCWRDPETQETFAYSCSYEYDLERSLKPHNLMVTPSFTLPGKGFSIKWDSRGSDADYLGDKYQVFVAKRGDFNPIVPSALLCEEVTTSATELTHHEYSLDLYEGVDVWVVFRHFESEGLSRLLITNVEVTNAR